VPETGKAMEAGRVVLRKASARGGFARMLKKKGKKKKHGTSSEESSEESETLEESESEGSEDEKQKKKKKAKEEDQGPSLTLVSALRKYYLSMPSGITSTLLRDQFVQTVPFVRDL
jgi:hypothetical protein